MSDREILIKHNKSLQIPRRISKRGRQYNDKRKKGKTTNHGRQNTTQKSNYWATRTTLKNGDEHRFSGRVAVPALLVASTVLLLYDTYIIWYWNHISQQHIGVEVMLFNTKVNSISAILWRSVLLVEESGVPG